MSTDAKSAFLERTASDLEWPELLERVASHCLTDAAVKRVRALLPAEELDEARRRTQRAEDVLVLLGTGEAIPRRGFPNVAEWLPRVRRGAAAEASELRDLGRMLSVAGEVRGFAARHRDAHPTLAAELDSDPELAKLVSQIAKAIAEDGSIKDSASPALRDARRRARALYQQLSARIKELARELSDVLRDPRPVERDGRFALPVRADAHRRVPGIVLGSSASGGTLYVVPAETTSLGNQLAMAESEVEHEEARVLAALSDAARERAEAIEVALEASIAADVAAAIGAWASETAAIAVPCDAEPGLDLVAMRHPLLVGSNQSVVANDLRLDGAQALVISGPNAGGKTVALKCLGLAAWMARAGLPLPVSPGSRVGWADPIFSDVGDDQSLARSLSSFSGHVSALSRMLELGGPHSLVLVDEMLAGTDPEEGSALAVAVLEAFVARGAAVAVTTHYERLKEFAADAPGFVNASVGFDLERMAPTFRFTRGVPGPSSALAVAARYGISEGIVERARALIPEQVHERETLLARLEAERVALEAARKDAEADRLRQRELTQELEHERGEARERERERLARESREITEQVRRARSALQEAKKKLLAEKQSEAELREAEALVNRAAQTVSVGSPLQRGSTRRASRPRASLGDLEVGRIVYLPRLGAKAQVLEPPAKGQVRIQAGALRMVASLDELELEPSAPRPAPQKPKPRRRPKPAPAQNAARGPHNTLDLRGVRVEDALESVDRFIDRMLGEGEPAGFVLHGHGTGALKAAVREHLRASPWVSRSNPCEREDGGDAFTVFWLSD